MSRVTVVIPNYNGLRFMEPCMSALSAQTYTDFCVLIVDNGSTDGSVEWLSSADMPFPVRSIFLKENTGFAGASNVGIEYADSELILLLNNDTEPKPSFIENLVRAFDEDRQGRLFAASPRMIQLYHKELLDDAGDGYNLFSWGFQRGVGRPVDEPKFARRTRVFSACAGASMYRKELLSRIAIQGTVSYEGLYGERYTCREYFDTKHFAYLEDMDLSFRAGSEGYDIYYIPDAEVYHVGSGTSGSKYNSFKVRLAARNNIWLCWKNMPLLMLILNLPGILTGIAIKILFFVKLGFGRDYLKGLSEGIRGIPGCRKKKFRFRNLFNYVRLELHMITDTFSYAEDFVRRKL